ncbi:MAG: UDP-2,4-diacetamido-2,4,6-trideoxy-beta-L-altropyranose hydrolase [Candidatus Saganbacteria bacterium]|nr:UDP-2,4-diacetamido-2,4,6-trideoxy-beta-L-altropyranose hydrolase [Candidatus Saganbacteria bacterium]
MKILILTEGGKNKGLGHIARCTALYQIFGEKGANPELIINGDNTLLYLLKDKNYQIFNWLKEKQRLFKIIAEADSIVIDSYLAPKSFYNKISQVFSGQLIMLDDLNRLKYPRGIVINPSIYGDTLNYPQNDEIIYLLGRDYIILRKPFWSVPRKQARKRVKNILIAFGGTEQNGFLNKLLEYLSKNYPDFNYHLVASNFYPKPDLCLKLNLYSKLSAEEIKRLMSKCDFCISAGGQTLYELVRTSTPTIAVCFAQNQSIGLEFFKRKGLIEDVGWVSANDIWRRLARSFGKLLLYKTRNRMIKNNTIIIDGKGPRRLCKILKGTK